MSLNTTQWAKLVEEGRAKAIGVSWNEEELKARYVENIPADYVRMGILTRAEYNKETEKENEDAKKGVIKVKLQDLMKLKKEDLMKKAHELKIEGVDLNVITRNDIMKIIMNAVNKPAEAINEQAAEQADINKDGSNLEPKVEEGQSS